MSYKETDVGERERQAQRNAGDEPFVPGTVLFVCFSFVFFFFLYYACVIFLYLWVWWVALLAPVLLPSLHPQLCHSFIMGNVYLPIP